MQNLIILDGGMGRELEAMGAPFRQPEWSALSLIEAPDYVLRAHCNYIKAGADVITSNAYAVVPFHIGPDQFDAQGEQLVRLAARLARQAADESGRRVRVAGCLPPVMGSYRADLFDADQAKPILETLIRAQDDLIDFWLAETISSVEEARLIHELVRAHSDKAFWLAYTLTDRTSAAEKKENPELRSHERITRAARAAYDMKVDALLFNCTQPEDMLEALEISLPLRPDETTRLGIYANAFPVEKIEENANEGITTLREDVSPQGYLEFAKSWQQAGASIIGGCCGIGPDHIRQITSLKMH